MYLVVCVFKGHEYVLERQGRPGKPVNADATLASMRTFEFCLVKENSKLNSLTGPCMCL